MFLLPMAPVYMVGDSRSFDNAFDDAHGCLFPEPKPKITPK
jgi:hypothetical protein